MSLLRIHDGNYRDHAFPNTRSRGLIPRNYNKYPLGHYKHAKPFDMPLIPRNEWKSRLADTKGAQLSDIRNRAMFGKVMPSVDQDGYGFCWAHSSTSSCLLVRALDNQPYVPLSAFSVAAPIKNFRDEGGWGAESLEWIAEKGVASGKFWPQQAMDRKLATNPEVLANAKLHRFTEWMDIDPGNIDQFVTCLLLNIPVVSDFNWWGHSVTTMNLEDIHEGWEIDTRIWNSWSDSWSENGTGILQGRKAVPDAMLAPRIVTASNA